MQRALLKRSRLQISTEILQTCRTPMVKTRLMQKLNLSFNTIQECLAQLQELKLLQLQHGTMEYATTGKGLDFLAKWMQLQEFLKPEEKISLKIKVPNRL
ncbi:MAG: winged helix-turn-helix domain-containing protein [Candidatus Bathyarchaeia archaeon]